jgi:hypothetical protein
MHDAAGSLPYRLLTARSSAGDPRRQSRAARACSRFAEVKIQKDTHEVLRSREVMKRSADSSLYFPATDAKPIQTPPDASIRDKRSRRRSSIAAQNSPQ